VCEESGHWNGELWQQSKDGEEFLAAMVVNAVYDEQGNPFRYVALLSDITQKKASEELIWRQANFDTLPGLQNRNMLYEHLRQEMKKTDRSQLPMALVFVDLDYFKEINDTLGHDKGDVLLKQVAIRLISCVRTSDIVARLGGDEFTVISANCANRPTSSALRRKFSRK
jgi:GGDEF domain-containing protein